MDIDSIKRRAAGPYGYAALSSTEIDWLIKQAQGKEAAVQQARIWKLVARGASAALAECYQVATGKTGEPGDWNGAHPVRTTIGELRYVLRYIIAALPVRRDWLNPDVERLAKRLLQCEH